MKPLTDKPSFREFIRQQWKPRQVQPPKVDPDLVQMCHVERSAEVTRYSFLSFEWWLSPNGTLREWLRLHSKLGCLLLIPALLILPLITFVIQQIAGWVVFLGSLAMHLILIPLAMLLALVLGLFAFAVIRTITGK